MAISHCYWHLVVNNDNFTLLLTSSGPEWQFHIATDVQWSKMAISHCYWHIVVKKGNFTLLLTTSCQEWQFDISTVRVHIGGSTSRSTPPKLSIDALNTTTPNLAHLMADLYIYRQSIYPWQINPTQSIYHRCLEYYYTRLGTSHHRSIYIYIDNTHIPNAIEHRSSPINRG